jgi:hypothetical protein
MMHEMRFPKITRKWPGFGPITAAISPRKPFAVWTVKKAQLTKQKGHRRKPMALKLGAGVGFEPTTFRL